jgi:homoserine O-acetyltransferase/O-succinyltransferase
MTKSIEIVSIRGGQQSQRKERSCPSAGPHLCGHAQRPRRRATFALVALLTVAAHPALAHGPNQPPHQLYRIGDLKLESGETIRDFSISYVTHGTLNAKKSNAILMVTAISGNHHRLDFLIGPGKALDTDKYFIVCTDAIGNGLTTSPSNSTAQSHMKFPHFLIRDMVTSQHKLMTEHLGIQHVVSVIGPSMGGMQTLQWGVSYPDFMDSLVALVPLARTPAWTVTVLEATRKAIMLDPAWKGGDYGEPPEQGIRLWRDILNFLAARTPELSRDQFPNQLDILPWIKEQETGLIKAFDANDWIYQTWAYDQHDIGTTPGMNGDLVKALRTIKAKTLIMVGTKDLLNPEWEPREAARYVRDVRVSTISPSTVTGHASAGGALPADVDFLNGEITGFLNVVTQKGKRLE